MHPVILVFNYPAYIANPQFALYSDPTDYPEVTLQAYWDNATNYISRVGNYGNIQGHQREYAIQLMMSHLIYITNLANTGNGSGGGSGGGSSGGVPGQLQSATIDKVSITVTPPPSQNQFQWWLGLSPFGQQLLAMLQIHSVGGEYFGGSSVRAGFRGSDNGTWPWVL